MSWRCFIAHVTDVLKIPKKDHFDYNQPSIFNNNKTKRIEIRKVKAYPMNITAFIEFTVGDVNNDPGNTVITYSFIKNQPISALLNDITKFINDSVNTLFKVKYWELL
jgi:hypothetical protein